MPTVTRIGAYRFFFFSNEGTEPPHVHVEREDALAKFQQRFLEAWHDFFGR